MTRTLIIFFLVVLCCGLNAQWSADAATPNQIYNATSAQVMPKTAVASGGDSYIAWLDNTQGTYYTYLQRLNVMGTAVWANPVIVSDNPTETWTSEWDIDADAEGNAVLTFQDTRLGTSNVVVYKISPAGDFLWGDDGIMLSNDTSTDYGNMAPVVLCLTDGRTVVGWQRMSTKTATVLQCLSLTGELLWGAAGISFSSTTISYTWPQLLESDNGNVLLKYFEDSGPVWAPTRKILVQKLNETGIALWTTPTYASNLGGISAWTQLFSIVSDGIGGMILVWHDDRLAENISYSYVQHVAVDGSVTMPANGIKVSTENGFHQFYPKVAFDTALQEIYVVWNRLNGSQSMWSLFMQKISLNGELLWAGNGMEIVPIGNNPTFPISAGKMDSGIVFIFAYGPVSGNDLVANLKAFCTNPAGQAVWAGGLVNIATSNTQKLHYNCAISGQQWAVITWEDGGGPSNTYAMRINYNGTLGISYPVPFNLTAQVTGTSVHLTWEFPETFIPPTGYKVYRNGTLITQLNDVMMYDVAGLPYGEWTFYVTALFEGGVESAPSNSVTVNITGIDDPENISIPLSLNISPNPFQKQAYFAIKGMNSTAPTQLFIYNIKGQLVQQTSFSGKSETAWIWDGKDMNQSDVHPGIYLIRICTDSKSLVTKILKQ